MAEEKTPSPQPEGAKPAEPTKKRSMMLPLILTAVVSSALGAGVVLFMPVKHADKDVAAKKEEDKKPLEPKFSATMLELMFNPAEKRRSRTCRINMLFQFIAKDPVATEKLIEERKEGAKSEILIYLSDRKLEEVQGSENLMILRKELRERLERVFFPKGEAKLHDVFFTDVLVQ